jgi:hypothetical protein
MGAGGGGAGGGGFMDNNGPFGPDQMVIENLNILVNALMEKIGEQQDINTSQQLTLMDQQEAIRQLQQQNDQKFR